MTEVDRFEHPEDGVEEVWVADPCGGAFGGGTSEIRVYHVETNELDSVDDLITFWEGDLSNRTPERILKPEFLFSV